MDLKFNPPPNWPTPPDGWTPPAGWEPHPSWGEPPQGWKLWGESGNLSPQKKKQKKRAQKSFDQQIEGKGKSRPQKSAVFGYNSSEKKRNRYTSRAFSFLIGAIAVALTGLLTSYALAFSQRYMPDAQYYRMANGESYEISKMVSYSAPTDNTHTALKNAETNPPVVLEGEGEQTLTISNPSGEGAPIWAEYEFKSSKEDREANRGGTVYFFKNHSFIEYGIGSDVILPESNRDSTEASQGSSWVDPHGEPMTVMQVKNFEGHWKITLHSAHDAPVVTAGDEISGEKNSAFIYRSEEPGKAVVDYRLKDGSESRDLPESRKYESYQLFSLSYSFNNGNLNHPLLNSSLKEQEATVTLLPGSYPLEVNPADRQWSIHFENAAQPGTPDLTQQITYSEDGAQTVRGAEDQNRVELYRDNGKQQGPALLKYSNIADGNTELVSASGIDFSSIRPLVFAGDTGYTPIEIDEFAETPAVKVRSTTEWELSVLPVDAIPTYQPGETVSSTGSATFWWDGSHESLVTLKKEAQGKWQEDSISVQYHRGQIGSMARTEAYAGKSANLETTFSIPKERLLVTVQSPAGAPWSMSFSK